VTVGNNFSVRIRDGEAFFGLRFDVVPEKNEAHCDRCGARLRREKAARELCDPCDEAQRREDQRREAEAAAAAAEVEPHCRKCGGWPVVVRSGIYAWLCESCRDAARDGREAA
jgi:Zn finger protein HypA/HybF involved in hydrogenase expression